MFYVHVLTLTTVVHLYKTKKCLIAFNLSLSLSEQLYAIFTRFLMTGDTLRLTGDVYVHLVEVYSQFQRKRAESSTPCHINIRFR